MSVVRTNHRAQEYPEWVRWLIRWLFFHPRGRLVWMFKEWVRSKTGIQLGWPFRDFAWKLCSCGMGKWHAGSCLVRFNPRLPLVVDEGEDAGSGLDDGVGGGGF